MAEERTDGPTPLANLLVAVAVTAFLYVSVWDGRAPVPSSREVAGLAAVVGLVLGVGYAYVVERRGRTVRGKTALFVVLLVTVAILVVFPGGPPDAVFFAIVTAVWAETAAVVWMTVSPARPQGAV